MDWELYKNIFDDVIRTDLKESQLQNLYQLFNRIFNDGYRAGKTDMYLEIKKG